MNDRELCNACGTAQNDAGGPRARWLKYRCHHVRRSATEALL